MHARTRRRAIGGFGRLVLLVALAPAVGWAVEQQPLPAEDLAARILEATGVQGGLVVHLGCGDGKLTAALGAGDGYLVQGLDADGANVEKARSHIRSRGLYGPVSIDRFAGSRLPYVDNLVNLIVSEDLGPVSVGEALRVLAPGGVAYVKTGGAWTKKVKPRPGEMDEWTHYLYDATGNAVSNDSLVGPPRQLQWVGLPKWARSHDHLASVSAVVSSGGRIFYIVDEAPAAAVVIEPKWFLVARDAFSGVVLWKRPIENWQYHLRGFRSGPSELGRRLVAVGDRVYVTLGIDAALTALDAATGRVVTTYQGTGGTSEVVYADGTLFVVAAAQGARSAVAKAERRGQRPGFTEVRSQRPASLETPPLKRLTAIDADTRRVLWTRSDADTAELMPTTVAVSRNRVFFQNADHLLCLDAKTGKQIWQAERPSSRTRFTWSAPTLVVCGEVVLSGDRQVVDEKTFEDDDGRKVEWVASSAGGRSPVGELIAYSASDGKRLWSGPARECYNAPVDVLVAGGLVWTGSLVRASDPGITEGRDLVTGEVKRTRPDDNTFFVPGMGHHRCYRNKGTCRYLLLGRSGVEFVDVATGDVVPNHWTRGTCQYGVMPANGFLYVPPHSCACFIEAKLNSFNCFTSKRDGQPVEASKKGRLERGPAFGRGESGAGRGERPSAVRGSPDPARQDDRRSPQAGRPPVAPSAGSGDPRRAQVGDPRRAHDLPPRPSPLTPRPSSDWPTYRHDSARSGLTATKVPAELKQAWKTKLGGRLSSVVIAGGKVFVASIDEHTVHALDAADGTALWSFTAGGRVDSPPTIYPFVVPPSGGKSFVVPPSGGKSDTKGGRPPKGGTTNSRGTTNSLCLFGSADGWVYCLSAADGRLAWRFRAAPADRRIVAYGQVESVWPVHGNVLVHDGTAYCAAGRSSYLDGGIRLVRLDASTGRLLSETTIDDRDPETGFQRKGVVRVTTMPGALPDILTCDGESVFLRHLRFDLSGQAQESDVPHLYSPAGFLDDAWWHRTYWLVGTAMGSNYGGWPRSGSRQPAGRILALDDSTVYGFGRNQYIHHGAHIGIDGATVFHFRPDRDAERRFTHYQAFAMGREAPQAVPRPAGAKGKRRRKPPAPPKQYRWTQELPLMARAMVLSPGTLLLAGPPDVFTSRDPAAALAGAEGGVLCALATADGSRVAQYPLESPPVFDGLAAAGGRLYLAAVDGSVSCFSSEGPEK